MNPAGKIVAALHTHGPARLDQVQARANVRPLTAKHILQELVREGRVHFEAKDPLQKGSCDTYTLIPAHGRGWDALAATAPAVAAPVGA